MYPQILWDPWIHPEMAGVVLVCPEMTANINIFSPVQKYQTLPLYLAECYPERFFYKL
jgi:hypothetical protein